MIKKMVTSNEKNILKLNCRGTIIELRGDMINISDHLKNLVELGTESEYINCSAIMMHKLLDLLPESETDNEMMYNISDFLGYTGITLKKDYKRIIDECLEKNDDIIYVNSVFNTLMSNLRKKYLTTTGHNYESFVHGRVNNFLGKCLDKYNKIDKEHIFLINIGTLAHIIVEEQNFKLKHCFRTHGNQLIDEKTIDKKILNDIYNNSAYAFSICLRQTLSETHGTYETYEIFDMTKIK